MGKNGTPYKRTPFPRLVPAIFFEAVLKSNRFECPQGHRKLSAFEALLENVDKLTCVKKFRIVRV